MDSNQVAPICSDTAPVADEIEALRSKVIKLEKALKSAEATRGSGARLAELEKVKRRAAIRQLAISRENETLLGAVNKRTAENLALRDELATTRREVQQLRTLLSEKHPDLKREIQLIAAPPKDLLIPGLSTLPYVTSPDHKLLATDVDPEIGPNIGRYGHDLTISCLSLNRSHLTLRLLRSLEKHIPFFKGEFLIIDNGSEVSEIKILKEAASTSNLRVRLVELGKNFGVGGGRNRTIPHVTTNWVMFLDNDIYLTGDPFPEIQQAIASLGCHFLNVPLLNPDHKTLFSNGGHLYCSVLGDDLHLGAGSAYQQGSVDDFRRGEFFLSSFLFGGASVLSKKSFEQHGGFDEGMFIGFEDLDFSLRLFREGIKVGSVQAFHFVHAHEEAKRDADVDYERMRFSRTRLKQSADHFHSKHGFSVWSDAVDHWLEEQEKKHGFSRPEAGATVPDATGDTASLVEIGATRAVPKIALVVDSEDWAFANISRQVRRYLSDEFDFTIIPADVMEGDVTKLLSIAGEFDIVQVFWREFLLGLLHPKTAEYFSDRKLDAKAFLVELFTKTAFVMPVYDHLYTDEVSIRAREVLFQEIANSYYVSSNRLNKIYSDFTSYPKPTATLPDGVDLVKFYPKNLERFSSINKDRPLVVGWSGNSKWSFEVTDFKGFHTVLKPAIERLQSEGVSVMGHYADRQVKMIPLEEMVDYYASIDVYVCTSLIEGTPNGVLEAMACGVPVITTDVGVVPDVFGAKQREFILEERTPERFAMAIKALVEQPQRLSELSSENLGSIRGWDWRVKAEDFRAFFRKAINVHKSEPRAKERAEAVLKSWEGRGI